MKKLCLLASIVLMPLLSGCNNEPTKELRSISLTDMTTRFELNSTFEFDGKVEAFYSDNTSEFVEYTDYEAPDMSLLGKQEVVIYYQEGTVKVSDKYDIEIYKLDEITLSSISIKDVKTDYFVNEEYVFEGTVIAKYSDGSTKEVNPTTISKVDTSNKGSKEVTITYEEDNVSKNATLNINIYAKLPLNELKKNAEYVYSIFTDEPFLDEEECYDADEELYFFSFYVGEDTSLKDKKDNMNNLSEYLKEMGINLLFEPREFNWEDEETSDIEIAFKINSGLIYVEVGTFVEDDELFVEVHVMLDEYVKLIQEELLHSYKYTFLDCGFLGSFDKEEKVSEFEDFLKKSDNGLIKSLNVTGFAQIQNYDVAITTEKVAKHDVFILGSSKTDGELTINFSKPIKSITYEYQNYNKYVEYNSQWNVDANSKLEVRASNTTTHDLSVVDTSKPPLMKTNTIEFIEPITSLSFLNHDGRVFLHSLTITY